MEPPFGLFGNNARVAPLLWTGWLTAGLVTFVGLLFNGLVVGVLLKNLSGPASLVLVIPHGVFELPGLFIASATGYMFPGELIQYLRGEKRRWLTGDDISDMFLLLAGALVLIFVAAVVEAWMTPLLGRLVT